MAETSKTEEQTLLDNIKGQVSEQLQGFATKESLAELTTTLKSVADDVKNSDEFKTLTKGLEEATLRLAALSEKGGEPAQEKGSLVKFIERDSLEKNFKSQKQGMEQMPVKTGALMKAADLMTTANVKPVAGGAFSALFGNYIDPLIHHAPKADNFILDLITVRPAAGTENIWYTDRINEEGDAQFIGEGDLKPLIDAEWQQQKADVKEVAERWKMSNRLIMHAPSVVSDFRIHADELIENKIDDGILVGDGTGNELNGLITLAGAFVCPTELANYYAKANIYDAIMAVSTAVKLGNFKGQITCVLNTVWEAKMKGIKNTEGDYIMPAFVSPNGQAVGSVRVVFSNRMPADKILCGDLRKFTAVIAEDVMYYEGWENDDFSKNLSSRKLEAFMGTYIPQSYAGSIIFDDISTVLTDIATVEP